MSDYTELKRLAMAFPADLDWDSNTEPFFNGPSGESLGGGSTGFYCVYGAAFEIDGEQYEGHTYVETCKVDFAKFMVAARDGVLALIAENERLNTECKQLILLEHKGGTVEAATNLLAERDQLRAEIAGLKTGYEAYERVNAELKAENEALRKLAPSKEIIWCACGDGHAANSYGAGFMDANGGVCANCDAAMGKGERP